MKPHTELLQVMTNTILYELGRHFRPRPDWHRPDHSMCWIWRGPVTGGARGIAHKRLGYHGRTTHYVNHKSTPVLSLGSDYKLDIRRFLFHLYRTPDMPVNRLKQSHCITANCVNPWHHTPSYSPDRKKQALWPQNSPLEMLHPFLAGEMAQDPESLSEREEKRLRMEIEYKQELGKQYQLIPLNSLLTTDASKFENRIAQREAPPEVHQWAKNYWLVDRMTLLPYSGDVEEYNAAAHYISVLKRWVPDLSEGSLSEDLRTLLQWYSLRLPPLPRNISRNDDYWIGRHELGDGYSVLEEAVNMKIPTGSEVLRLDKKVHCRLVLLKIGELLNNEIKRIDWTK
jgi:hypothetical protein